MKVTDIAVRAFWKGEFGVTGQVEDQGQIYDVKLEVKGSYVNSCSCSCAQGNSYQGMCVHEQELLAHYRTMEHEKRKEAVFTSSQVRAMVREYTNREVEEIVGEEEEAPVAFLPCLILDREEVKLEFRIGRERFYVVKDLVAFARAVEHGSYVEYGKNLAFHHNLRVFRKDLAPLVELVLDLVNTYREHYVQFQKNSYGTVPPLRQLSLSKTGCDRFLKLWEGQDLEVEEIHRGKRQVKVQKENPQPVITVRKTGKDGIRVSVDKRLSSFQGERHLYLLNHDQLSICDDNCSRTLQVFFRQMTQGWGAPYEVSVNERDIPLFYERVLRKLEPYVVMDVKGIELEAYRPIELQARFDFDNPHPGEVIMRPTLRYGDYTFHPVEDEQLPRTVCRDVPGEFRISQAITRYFKYRDPQTNDLIIKDDDDALYLLLSKGMEELQSLGEIYVSDSWSHMKILSSPKISMGVSTTENWLELKIEAEDLTGADLYKILTEYRRKKPYYRLKNGEFLKLEDGGLMTVARMVDGLSLSKNEMQQETIRLPRYRALYMDSLYKEGSGITMYRDNLFKAIVRGMKSVEDSEFEVPESLNPVLRGYQKAGFCWLRTLDSYGFGGILADDMGLGKTIQIISLFLDESERKRTRVGESRVSLVICPASLVYNWECEIRNFAPALKVQTIIGSSQERETRLQQAGEYDVIITSYDLLKRDIALYEPLKFRFQVIDEAQYIKNPGTQSARAVKLIHAQTRYALTGTPIENRLSELWSIFDYLMPGFLYTYPKFRKVYEQPIVKEGDEAVLKNLHQMAGPFILRRLKTDVLKELPDKLETIVYSKLDGAQRDLYTANALQLKQELEGQSEQQYGTGKIQILAELTKLRQICCDPRLYYENYRSVSAKTETCMELIVNGIEGGHKILLFSQFTSMLTILGQRLGKEGISYHALTGATSKEERLRMVNSFQKDEVPVFLISLKAGGTGLNLTAADMVIHYDPWWNVAAQNQATDRTHRIGQKKQVSVFKLIMKETIEENIINLQESKKNLAEQVITTGTVSMGSLSRDDLVKLLSLTETALPELEVGKERKS